MYIQTHSTVRNRGLILFRGNASRNTAARSKFVFNLNQRLKDEFKDEGEMRIKMKIQILLTIEESELLFLSMPLDGVLGRRRRHAS